MRIRSTGRPASGPATTSADRGAAFRRHHRVGEQVTGRVIRAEKGDMFWVAFDGEPLLTTIPNCPPPGSLLTFQVLQLFPEITLKECPQGRGGGGKGLSGGVQDFYAARAAYEAGLDSREPLPVGREAYLAALDPELSALLERVNASVAAINAALERPAPGAEARADRLAYPPWIAPRARELELLTALPAEGLGRAVLGLRLPPFGVVQIRAMLRPPLLRCRVYAEQPQDAARLAPLLGEAVPCPEGQWTLECHGAEILPKRFRGGLPAELLAPLAPTLSL